MCGECGCETSMHCPIKPHGRHFLAKEEKIKRLENYAEDLKKEIVAVNERIKELKS